jgi:hypothetical protein
VDKEPGPLLDSPPAPAPAPDALLAFLPPVAIPEPDPFVAAPVIVIAFVLRDALPAVLFFLEGTVPSFAFG